MRLLRDRERWAHDAGLPASLTTVAATAVLGSRLALAGSPGVAWALAAAEHVPPARATASVGVWVAVAVWAGVAAGAVRRLVARRSAAGRFATTSL